MSKERKKPVRRGAYTVQVNMAESEWRDVDLQFDGLRDAESWVKENGDPGETYHVVVAYPAVKIAEVTQRKLELV